MSSDLQHNIWQALISVSSSYAEMVMSPKTQMVALPASFLVDYHLYEFTYRAPNKPVQFYVAYAEDKPIYLITGQPENYFKMAQADHVRLDTAPKAVEYITLYLKVSRPMNNLFYVVSSVDQVKFRPNLEAAENAIRSTFLKQYEGVIHNPDSVQFDGQQYVITVYVIHGQDFKQYKMTVDTAGRLLNTGINVLEKDLPLVYGL